jgi:hypothetical protein
MDPIGKVKIIIFGIILYYTLLFIDIIYTLLCSIILYYYFIQLEFDSDELILYFHFI